VAHTASEPSSRNVEYCCSHGILEWWKRLRRSEILNHCGATPCKLSITSMPGEEAMIFRQNGSQVLACAMKYLKCTNVTGDPSVDIFEYAGLRIAIPGGS